MSPRRPFASQFFRSRVAPAVLIFLLAFGVRVLSWHDTRPEVGKVQTAVTADYVRVADLLKQGGLRSFFSSASPLADLNNLGHPPGYSILLALLRSSFANSTTAAQFVQIAFDSVAAVLIFLIVGEVLPVSAALVAALLAACSPQFAWNSVLLLPDSLAVVPILLAVYLITRGIRNPRVVSFAMAGMLVGISCWLRANAMLLTFFLAALPLLILKRNRGWRFALVVIFGTALTILPLTIRNAIVFRRFIPLSLGAGQTFLEGISEYDTHAQFGVPRTDIGIMKQEAEQLGRPDYYGTLFYPDGVERERARLARGLSIVRSHPVWFAGVMIRRASSMLRLERARLISTEPPVTHSLDVVDKLSPLVSRSPAEILALGRIVSPTANGSLLDDARWLAITGDESTYGEQFSSLSETVKQNTDYLFKLPVRIERGRMRLSVKGDDGKLYGSEVIETLETHSEADQPLQVIQLPFVTDKAQQVHIVLSNEASIPAKPAVRIGTIGLYELGPSRFLWTRYPRFLVHAIQKLFLTALMLPLALFGIALLIVQKRWTALTILLVVPFYYLTVQSWVHTEYRYVLAVDYFLFALAGIAVSAIARAVATRASFGSVGRRLIR